MKRGRSLCGWPFLFDLLSDLSLFTGKDSELAVPLLFGMKNVGVITFVSENGRFFHFDHRPVM